MLYQLQPNPVVAMNKAIASAYAFNRQQALDELLKIKGLEQHHLYHASVGEMHFELNEKKEALAHFEKALALTGSASEKQLLKEKINLC
jgi:predicted RNA polymerase sigma factor